MVRLAVELFLLLVELELQLTVGLVELVLLVQLMVLAVAAVAAVEVY
jgi:hypothetical protein